MSFTPRLEISEWLSRTVKVNAMLDVSDGLSIDLYRMMEASGAAAEIQTAAIPIHPDVPTNLSADKRLAAALSDGEDFELLFTVSGSDILQLEAAAEAAKISLYQIGRVTVGSGVTLIDSFGGHRTMEVSGWQHSL